MNLHFYSFLNSYRFLILLIALALTSFLIGTSTGIHHAESGRDSAVQVGMYLDEAFPNLDPNSSLNWKIVDAFPFLSFHNPIYLLQEPETNDLWVAEHGGKIYRFEKRTDITEADKVLILDLSNQVKQDDASGIKSFAFHPEYGQEGSQNANYVYLFYRFTPNPPADDDKAYLRVSRFSVAEDGTIDSSSEYVLIHQFSYSRWHDGGDLAFDKEGFLYISLGEDTDVNKAQTLNGGLFGGVLRIDVDKNPSRSHPIRRQPLNQAGELPDGWEDSYSQGYYIPNHNPWVDESGQYLEEFYAVGLRSPHRMTYDEGGDNMWIGDVGEYRREEINILEKKANYGWPIWEAELPGDKVGNTVLTEGDLTFPVYAYSHSEGQAIIGGHVYRGTAFSQELGGKYIYADYNTRNIYALSQNELTGEQDVEFLAKSPVGGLLGGIGKDTDNELYFIRWGYYDQSNGRIYKLEKSEQETSNAPALLSQTGAFSNLQSLTPKEALIPYSVVTPLWSDGALKQRWFSVPNNGTHDYPQEQFVFSEEGNWEFPIGTVFVKQFDYKDTKIETRFLIRGDDGEWYGLSYKWKEDQSDAELLHEGLTTTINTGNENIEWQFPSSAECFRCHTDNAGIILGFRTRQLNKYSYYPTTGRTANQLHTYASLGLLGNTFEESRLDGVLTSAALDDTNAEVSLRVRSYLDSNCSHCHHPGGPAVALFDARLTTPLEQQNLINGPVVKPPEPGAAIIKPGYPDQSVLYLRLNSLEEGLAMPPLAKKKLDPEALELLLEWINDPLLPVELVNFRGLADGETIHLQWETLSEQENYGFEVQRLSASSEFVKIGFVDGQGTTNESHTYFFEDKNPPTGSEAVQYRLKQIDYDGQFEYSSEIAIVLDIPGITLLHDNYPDPFNPATTIEYEVPVGGFVKLTLYDMLGREVKKLVEAAQPAGRYRITLDATHLPSGTYIYQLENGNSMLSKTMVLAK